MSKTVLLLVIALAAGAIAAPADATLSPDQDHIAVPSPSGPTDDSMWVKLDSITSQGQVQCIYVRNDTVFCAQQYGMVIYRNRLTGAVIDSFALQTGSSAIAICAFGDSLCVSRLSSPEKCEVYTLDGTYARQFTPTGGYQVRGLDWDGARFWATSYVGGALTIYLMYPSGAVHRTLSQAGGVVTPTIARDLVLDRMYPNRLWTNPYSSSGSLIAMYVSFDTLGGSSFTPTDTFRTTLPFYMSGIGFRSDPVDGGCVYASTFGGTWIWRIKVHEPVAGAKCLVAGAYSSGSSIKRLADTLAMYGGGHFTAYDTINGRFRNPPSAASLWTDGYRAILAYSDANWSDTTIWGNTLADFVELGGGVVVGVFSDCTVLGMTQLGGRWNQRYRLWELNGNSFASGTLGTVHVPGHPIMTGVTSLGCSNYRTAATTPRVSTYLTRVADWAEGGTLQCVAYDSADRRTAYIGFYPGTPWVGASLSGQWITQLNNALRWSCGQLTGVEAIEPLVPATNVSLAVGPNPATSRARIGYAAPGVATVELAVYDAGGRLVRTLVSGGSGAANRLSWNLDDARGRKVPGGVYFCKLVAGSRTVGRKLVVR